MNRKKKNRVFGSIVIIIVFISALIGSQYEKHKTSSTYLIHSIILSAVIPILMGIDIALGEYLI